MDNEEQGYIPDRQREINTLAGVETAVIAQPGSDGSDAESEAEAKSESSSAEEEVKAVTNKGDADSSSDEDSDESESEEKVVAKKAPKRVDKQAKNDKLKKDLQKEQ